jgi:predicted Zn-dependent peptidase
MMFKGTARRSPFDINREFDEMGALYNAFTSEENTVYWGAVLPEFQDRLLDLLGDMLRPALRNEDFDTEKNVILEEIALYEDRPQFRLYEKLMMQHFEEHPLGQLVLGTKESVRALKRDDMLAYFNRRYSPTNVTLVGVGNLDWEQFVTKAGQMCGHWKPYEVSRQLKRHGAVVKSAAVQDAKLVRQHVGMMSPGPSAQDDDRYAAHLLSAILGDETGSRLFYALIDPAIAEEASCGFDEMDGAGAFITFISADPDRASEAVEIARREFAKFLREGPTEQEMSAAKNKTASGITLKGELPMGRLTSVGFDWVYRKSYTQLSEHIDRVLAVSSEQVLELARKYDILATTQLTLGPKEGLSQ